MGVYVCACVRACMCVNMKACVSVCMCMCMCMCMYESVFGVYEGVCSVAHTPP